MGLRNITDKSHYHEKERLESINSDHKILLSRRCDSLISINVASENYNNTNERSLHHGYESDHQQMVLKTFPRHGCLHS